MIFLLISAGRVKQACRVFWYGQENTGKTLWTTRSSNLTVLLTQSHSYTKFWNNQKHTWLYRSIVVPIATSHSQGGYQKYPKIQNQSDFFKYLEKRLMQ